MNEQRLTINDLKDIMAKLRDPDSGCPWDVEQDFNSIAKHTIEEAYEVVDAIEKGDMNALKEELGDLLLQVIFHSQMADEAKYFNFDDVVEYISDKMIKRHPHVFAGDDTIKTAKDQESAWEAQKAVERQEKANNEGRDASILSGVALSLPALTRSVKLQARAAKVGFDWPDLSGVYAKIDEELGEVKDAVANDGDIKGEIGDLLFAVANLARKLSIDPEEAIRSTNNKFIQRFNYLEKNIDKSLENASLDEMDALWSEAKRSC